ncbi:SDR family oxidoreductase [Carnobacterium viridans]|uniref:SDR family NAD(P)-dependent oxidoreductase n=1 Tax=Carnobacterium viridans TaxID=174587 RepID=UPI001CFFF4FF|nr:SDR family NAD(P)-dependent oxidoreductase [Carnobacterium viridans]UDE94673.1 SDR family oxidoreductase [Carnobacterium viridans]
MEAGAIVVSGDLNYEEGFKLETGRFAVSKLNVASEESVNDLLKSTLEAFGKVNILVNSAGISTMDLMVDSQVLDWDKVMDVNAKGVYLTSKNVGKLMQKAGNGGRIIQIASQAGKNGYTALGTYVASKHAVLGLTKTLAKELAKDNILVNAVCPGVVETEMKHRERVEGGLIRGMTPEEIYDEDCSQIPLARTAKASEIADVVLFLASHLSAYMTGQAINVTGGMTMH